MGSVAVHRIQHKLNLLHPEIFPLLEDKGIPLQESATAENGNSRSKDAEAESEVSDRTLSSDLFSVIQARTFCTVHLRPKRNVDR